MSHWQKAVVMFVGLPTAFVMTVLVHDFLSDRFRNTWVMQDYWWGPWVGGACMLLMFALVCWHLTE